MKYFYRLGKSGKVPEAILMKEIAINLDVPEDAIIIEKQSNNTTENILCSLLIFKQIYDKLII